MFGRKYLWIKCAEMSCVCSHPNHHNVGKIHHFLIMLAGSRWTVLKVDVMVNCMCFPNLSFYTWNQPYPTSLEYRELFFFPGSWWSDLIGLGTPMALGQIVKPFNFERSLRMQVLCCLFVFSWLMDGSLACWSATCTIKLLFVNILPYTSSHTFWGGIWTPKHLLRFGV